MLLNRMTYDHETGWFGARRLRVTMVLAVSWAVTSAAACAGGEEVLFDSMKKDGGSGGYAGSSLGSSGSINSGGSAGVASTGQGGSGQGGSGQGGTGQGGTGQGGSGQGGTGRGGAGQGGTGQGGSGQGGNAGTATGGSSGAGGSAGSTTTDASVSDVSVSDAPTTGCVVAPAGPPVSGQGITLRYQAINLDPVDAIIAFNLELTASTTLALNEIEVRYFFTNELTTPSTLELYYAGAGNSGRDITAKIVKSLVPVALGAGTNAYLSYTINDPGTVSAGEKITINPAFHTTDYQQKLSECNDYSYDATATSMKDNPRIAVYRNGTLIWGSPPGGSTPDGGVDARDAATDSPADQSAVDGPADVAADALSDVAADALPDAASEAGGD